MEQCACGSPYSTIERVEGRVSDYFILPSGEKIHSYRFFDPILRHAYPRIRQYQLVQTEPDRVILKLVPMKPGDSFPLADLVKEGQRILGTEMHFKVMLVQEIPQLPSGKIPTYQRLIPD
jgi:phenylacetate-coenzyme A ligase PaaK-like adenylate-forming protein